MLEPMLLLDFLKNFKMETVVLELRSNIQTSAYDGVSAALKLFELKYA